MFDNHRVYPHDLKLGTSTDFGVARLVWASLASRSFASRDWSELLCPVEVFPKMDLEGYIVGDRYEVKKRLQGGFYGVTWLCTDRQTMTDVCLKVSMATTSGWCVD